MERADDTYLLGQMTQEGTEHPRRCGQKSMRVGHFNETELCKTNAAFSTRKFKPLGQSHGCGTAVQVCHVTNGLLALQPFHKEKETQREAVLALEPKTQ